MYKIENKETYYIFCQTEWKNLCKDFAIVYGPKNRGPETDSFLVLTCDNFQDVLRYFARTYERRFQYLTEYPYRSYVSHIFDFPSYLSYCFIFDQDGRTIYPSMYKREIQRLLKSHDTQYQGCVKLANGYPLKYGQRKFLQKHPYMFRFDPVPHTGYRKQFFKQCYIRSIKIYTDAVDLDGVNEELEEMEIDVSLPRQKKREKKARKIYDYKYRHCDRSWKSSKKCEKQWMKNGVR